MKMRLWAIVAGIALSVTASARAQDRSPPLDPAHMELGIWAGGANIRGGTSQPVGGIWARAIPRDVIGLRAFVGTTLRPTRVNRRLGLPGSVSTWLIFGGIGIDLSWRTENVELGLHGGPAFIHGSRFRRANTRFAGWIGVHASFPLSVPSPRSPGVGLMFFVDFITPFRSIRLDDNALVGTTLVRSTKELGAMWIVGGGLSLRW